jgi:HlyD family secretion protein
LSCWASNSRFTFTSVGRPTVILHIRARVDERDAPRLRANSRAVAFMPDQGGRPHNQRLPRIEPLAAPRNQATGSNSEAVNTLVVEVLFRLDPADPSQLFDSKSGSYFRSVPEERKKGSFVS